MYAGNDRALTAHCNTHINRFSTKLRIGNFQKLIQVLKHTQVILILMSNFIKSQENLQKKRAALKFPNEARMWLLQL